MEFCDGLHVLASRRVQKTARYRHQQHVHVPEQGNGEATVCRVDYATTEGLHEALLEKSAERVGILGDKIDDEAYVESRTRHTVLALLERFRIAEVTILVVVGQTTPGVQTQAKQILVPQLADDPLLHDTGLRAVLQLVEQLLKAPSSPDGQRHASFAKQLAQRLQRPAPEERPAYQLAKGARVREIPVGLQRDQSQYVVGPRASQHQHVQRDARAHPHLPRFDLELAGLKGEVLVRVRRLLEHAQLGERLHDRRGGLSRHRPASQVQPLGNVHHAGRQPGLVAVQILHVRNLVGEVVLGGKDELGQLSAPIQQRVRGDGLKTRHGPLERRATIVVERIDFGQRHGMTPQGVEEAHRPQLLAPPVDDQQRSQSGPVGEIGIGASTQQNLGDKLAGSPLLAASGAASLKRMRRRRSPDWRPLPGRLLVGALEYIGE
ncbi:unnamed protein product [Trichogramma brassicae]|uniref:Uncharacterized protein n=1 Tax=Trichogramma brassicae TaxID=86971 RepID=A0A6H5J486_9HYME|nr:unnamed protein product [Trichogramma brassicae]